MLVSIKDEADEGKTNAWAFQEKIHAFQASSIGPLMRSRRKYIFTLSAPAHNANSPSQIASKSV
jgi:hypothetical protein